MRCNFGRGMVSVANRLVQANLPTSKYHKKYSTDASSIADSDLQSLWSVDLDTDCGRPRWPKERILYIKLEFYPFQYGSLNSNKKTRS
jgi:hypothetical protein